MATANDATPTSDPGFVTLPDGTRLPVVERRPRPLGVNLLIVYFVVVAALAAFAAVLLLRHSGGLAVLGMGLLALLFLLTAALLVGDRAGWWLALVQGVLDVLLGVVGFFFSMAGPDLTVSPMILALADDWVRAIITGPIILLILFQPATVAFYRIRADTEPAPGTDLA